jgi:glyoxalase family protein
MGPGRAGAGLTVTVSLAVPAGSLDYWRARLAENGVTGIRSEHRFGEPALAFLDPHGVSLALVEATGRDFVPWPGSPVPPEHQVRGLHAVRLWAGDRTPTFQFLMDGLGLTETATDGPSTRFSAARGGSGTAIDVEARPETPRGRWGVGSVHHVAWRVPDPAAQLELQRRVAAAGGRPTEVIDRFWFKSIYFKEPGGALFEIATDGPGFAIDESAESLGERLILPPWLEPSRPEIEAVLPPLPGGPG